MALTDTSCQVVRLQHRYYGAFTIHTYLWPYNASNYYTPSVPLALSLGLLLPTAIGSLWRDSLGAFVWAGLVSRLASTYLTVLTLISSHANAPRD